MATYFYDSVKSVCPKMVVIFDYVGHGPRELTVKAGEEVDVVESLNAHWVEAKSKDDRQGLLPMTFLRDPNSLEALPWFFPELSRLEAIELLLGEPAGTYLVRPSTGEKEYALSIRTNNPDQRIVHYKILYNTNKGFFIHINLSDYSLRKLVGIYQNDCHNRLNLKQRLQRVCPKTTPRVFVLTPNDEPIEPTDLSDMRRIGKGHYSHVYSAYYRHHRVAVKELRDVDNIDLDDLWQKELNPLRQLKHRNVVTLYGHCKDRQWLIFEYADHCLDDQLRSDVYNASQLVTIATQVARGMAYIHSLDFIHRDIAARNILITSDMVAKISDFGLSRKIYKGPYTPFIKMSMPVAWEALESLTKGVYDKASDVWMYAGLLYEMYTEGATPFKDYYKDRNAFIAMLKSGRRLEKPPRMPAEVYELQMKCMREKPKKRPTFLKIHEFFIKFE